MKKIYFHIQTRFGSSYLRGEQIAEALKTKGYETHIVTEVDPKIKDSIIFCIKGSLTEKHIWHKSNYIFWDLVDFISSDTTFDIFLNRFKFCDHLIYHNQKFANFIEELYVSEKDYTVIPHHWDVRLKNIGIPKNGFHLGYIGDTNSSSFLHLIQNQINCIGLDFRSDSFIENFKKFNCHFDIKNDYSFKFKCCSSVKLSTAAALGAGIILNKTWSNTELLPEDSIFFCEDFTEECVINKIKEMEELFYSKEWYRILEPLKIIKENTDINNIVKLYDEMIKNYGY